MTLPEGEAPGGRWERELRGRLGSRLLPQVVPFDEEMARAALDRQILCHANRQSPASQSYHEMVESFVLAADACPGAEKVDAKVVLVQASATVGAPVRRPVAPPVPTPAPALPAAETLPLVELPEVPETVEELVPEVPSRVRRRATPPSPVPAVAAALSQRPPSSPRVSVLHPEESPDSPAAPPVAPSQAPNRTKVRAARKSKSDEGGRQQQWALLWVGLAIAIGVALRFLRVPDWVLPILVGVAVAAVAVVLLRQFSSKEEGRKASHGARNRRPEEPKRSSGRSGSDNDVSKRLANMALRAKAAGKDVSEN